MTGHNDSVTIRESSGARRVADRDKVFQKREHCAGDCWSMGRDRQVTRFTHRNKSFERPMAPSLGFFLLNGPNRYSGTERSLEGSLSPKNLVDLSVDPISGIESCVSNSNRYIFTLRSAVSGFSSRFHISSSNIPRSTERLHLFCSSINRRVYSECTERFSRDTPPIRFLACKKKAVGTLHASPCRMCTASKLLEATSRKIVRRVACIDTNKTHGRPSMIARKTRPFARPHETTTRSKVIIARHFKGESFDVTG